MPAAPPVKYGLGYRYRTRTLTLNPNPKTDPNPNPKSNKNVCNTKRHRNKIQHRVIYKSYFVEQGWVYKRPTPGRWNKTVTEVFTVTEPEVWDILKNLYDVTHWTVLFIAYLFQLTEL